MSPKFWEAQWDAYVSTWAGWFYVVFMTGVVVPGAGDQWDADILTC